jgi:hypothetical protein
MASIHRLTKVIEIYGGLNISLLKIKDEIDRRTPESSQTIVEGRPGDFQTSIFDRTSSSSDTGRETPYNPDPAIIRWYGDEQDHSESPVALTHTMEDIRRQKPHPTRESRHIQTFMPYEEIGYENDLEGSIPMTLQSSTRTVKQESLPSPGGDWQTVKPRRQNQQERLENHRTINWLDQTRYHDRAGSYRAVIGSRTADPRAINPSLSHKLAKGFVQRTGSRGHSRSSVSGQSSAEAALTHISQISPPAPRGGGMVRDRSSSRNPGSAGRGAMRMGTSSYANAIIGQTNDTASGFRDGTQPIPIPNGSVTESVCSSALNSLRDKYPVDIIRHPASPRSPFTPMPPYPVTPSVDERERFFTDSTVYSDQFDVHMHDVDQPYGSPGQEIILAPYDGASSQLGVGPSTKVYPMKTGPLPIETQGQMRSRAHTGPPKRSLPHDYPSWHSQDYANNDDRVPSLMSLSSPNIRPSTYIPGRPELSFSSTEHGYSSQPMSRDTSGHSKQSRGRGRPQSVAETEPLPHRPNVSPPTSYQVYQNQNAPEVPQLRNLQRERSPAQRSRKSPRLSQGQQSLENWDGGIENLPPPRRAFNPATPAFQPGTLFSRANSTQTTLQPLHGDFIKPSPPLPHSAPVTQHPSPNSFTTNLPHHNSQWTPPPLPQHRTSPPHPLSNQFKPPARPNPTPWGVPRTFTPMEEPDPATPRFGGEEMGRSGSGGVKVGTRFVQFGETESVDTVHARARVERTWVERSESGLREAVGLGIRH